MSGVRLIETCWLDPTPVDAGGETSCWAAAHIPLTQFRERTNELPPTGASVQIVPAGAWVEPAIEALAALRRSGVAGGEAPQAAPGTRYRLWRPSALVERVAAPLPIGRAIDLGCGGGRDAVFLAAAGWRVVAVDVLPDALDIGRDLAARYLDRPDAVEWVQADLDAGVPACGRAFDLVVMVRYLDRGLLRDLRSLLRPGGSVVVETFTALHREHHGRPARDADALRPGELAALFAGLDVRSLEEEWSGAAHLAHGWAVVR